MRSKQQIDNGRRHVLKAGLAIGGGALVLHQVGCASNSTASSIAERPGKLMLALRDEALGVDSETLRFSWLLPESQAIQIASQVQIASSEEALELGNTLWDSGKSISAQSSSVEFSQNILLQPDAVYFWRVRTWDEKNVSQWSVPHKIITAPQTGQWPAKPIWLPATHKQNDWAFFRKTFAISDSGIAHAWLKLSGGSTKPSRQYVYKCWLNGEIVGVGPVRPMSSEHRFHTYDVTGLIAEGDNTLAAQCFSIDEQFFTAELIVQFKNGSRLQVLSDESWMVMGAERWMPDAGTFTDMYYHGPNEFIDAQYEPKNWKSAGKQSGEWDSAAITDVALSDMRPAKVDSAQLTKRLPASIEKVGKHHWILDFDKEVVGGIAFSGHGTAGQNVEIRLGEELNPDGTVRYKLRAFPVYRDVWTLRDGQQSLSHWGYRAFRWVEVITNAPLDISSSFTAEVLEMPWDETQSSFISNLAPLNKVWDLCHYSIKATRQDLYQDTPTRERGPYEGDAIINQLSEYYTQRSFGLAKYSVSYLIRNPTWPTEYRLLTSTLAWQDYLHSGDGHQLAEDYPLMLENQLLENINPVGLVQKPPGESSKVNGDLVDWPMSNRDSFDFKEVNTVVNCWQYASLIAIANIAGVLGKTEYQHRFNQIAERMRQAINQYLFDDAASRYLDGHLSTHASQHATIFALALGVAEKSKLPAIGEALTKDIKKRGVQVSAYAAQFLLEGLYLTGQYETALSVMTSDATFSWLNMINKHDATIVMEAWDPDIKPNTTFSHAWGSAPANIIPRFLAGIRVLSAGAARISVSPAPASVSSFDITVPTIRGVVEMSYNSARVASPLTFSVPPNVVAEVDLSKLGWGSTATISIAELNKGTILTNQKASEIFVLSGGKYVVSPR